VNIRQNYDLDKGGVKKDAGKLRWDLLPSDAAQAIVEVLTKGAEKYEDRNWEKGMCWSRPFAACMRHLWAWWRGEDKDPESGLDHLAHAGCCIMFMLAYTMREGMSIYDDRERLQLRDQRALQAKTK